MPPISWYINRLKTMSPDEVLWRVTDAGRDVVDRGRFAFGLYPSATLVGPGLPAAAAPFRVSEVPVGVWRDTAQEPFATWRGALVARADLLLAHRLTFFNLAGHDAGHPIDWNRDLESGQATPLSFAPAIDYRNPALSGDAKVVWEPNRHQHLVVLGRAYRATGDERYAAELIAQLVSWLDQSPFGRGMNWRSPLEFGIRMINWVWALDLIRESAAWTTAPHQRIRHAVYLHLWEITRRYSKGSSSNNHLVGEAAGVFVATAYFPDLPGAAAWHEDSRVKLERELFLQTHPDGATREQATGYHLFVLQFFLVIGIVARQLKRDVTPAYWARIELMYEYLAALVEAGPLPNMGDADDGFVLDLGEGGADGPGMLSAGAALFGRSDFARIGGGWRSWSYWLLGRDSDLVAGLTPTAPALLASRAFADAGHYLLQAGTAGTDDAASVFFDCAELGMGRLAAHGHADALSLVLRVGGVDILVDPGTYDYFTYPEWRRYLRSTAAHNTMRVDGQDQSVMSGPFMWRTRAEATLLSWAPGPDGGSASGEHDGYRRLSDPVTHRRHIELSKAHRRIIVRDEVVAAAEHDIELFFHFGERCAVTLTGGQARVVADGREYTMTFDTALPPTLLPSVQTGAGPGWVSRGYHVRVSAPSVVARGRIRGPATLTTTIGY